MKKATIVFDDATLRGLDELAAKLGQSRSAVIRSFLTGVHQDGEKQTTKELAVIAEVLQQVSTRFEALESLMVQLLERQARVPYLSEFVARLKAEGMSPSGSTMEIGLWFAKRYHEQFGIWPTPSDRGFPPMKSEDAAVWPSNPPA